VGVIQTGCRPLLLSALLLWLALGWLLNVITLPVG